MSLGEGILLGIVQGFCEFLPISSSGHLTLVFFLFKKKPDIFFEVLLHVGTLFSVVFWILIKRSLFSINKKVILLVLASFLSTCIFAFFLKEIAKACFLSQRAIAAFLLLSSFLLFFSESLKKEKKDITQISFKEAFLIGTLQSFCIFPGLSRTATLIFIMRLLRLKKESIFIYIVFLSFPTILAAFLYEALGIKLSISFPYIVGFLISFFCGILAIWLLWFVIKIKKLLYVCGIYCLFLAIFLII